MSKNGHIELERSVTSIVIGVRHRTEMGDLGPLMTSIQRLGLLQPITITPDGVLLCGRRRLEAVKQLGWRTLRVWVRSGLSDNLTSLLAQQDENTLHKPLAPLEAASLYRELKKVMAEDAARRQKATQFGAQRDVQRDREEGDGAADSASPATSTGTSRRQAAETVTGNASYSRLEQIAALENIAADSDQPETIRRLAAAELKGIGEGGPVNPAYERVQAAIRDARLNTPDDGAGEMEHLAAEALARLREGKKPERRLHPRPGRRGLRSFLLTWTELDGWTSSYDPDEIGLALSESGWKMFERAVQETTAFADAARRARAAGEQPVSA